MEIPAETATPAFAATSLALGGYADAATLWCLISPCSDAGEDESRGFSPGSEPTAADACDGGDESGDARESEGGGESEDEEEGEEASEIDVDAFWATVERPPVGEAAWWPESDIEGEDKDAEWAKSGERPEEAGVTLWRRLKARSYASAGVQAAVASVKQRARAVGARAAARRHLQLDDGDFSSDDEDCRRQSELHSGRAWRRRPSLGRHSLAAPLSLGRKLPLFRSSSSSNATITSEESFLGSPAAVSSAPKSAPARLRLGNKPGNASAALHVPDNLRAGVCMAAEYLNAASAEAARKLKAAKTTALRGRRKPEASETEEDEPAA